MPDRPLPKPYTEQAFKEDADRYIKGYLGGFDKGEIDQLLKNSVDKIENAGVMSSDEAKDFIKERAFYLKEFAKENKGETLPQLKEESKKTGDPFLDKLMFLPNTLDKIAEKIAPMLGYADGGRIGYNQGSMDPDTMALKEKIEEIMDIEGVGFEEAFKQAMRELASQSKE